MLPPYLAPLANHIWQSTLFAGAAGALSLALRTSHARARYWIWFAASAKFMVPTSLLVDLGGRLRWPRAHAAAPARLHLAIKEIGRPFAQQIFAPHFPTVATAVHHYKPALLGALWLAGYATVLFIWWRRWRRAAAILRQSTPLVDGRELEMLRRHPYGSRIELRSTEAAVEPAVFGVVRPALLWPVGISARLADAQIEAIIAHELCHVRRRDNLAAALHMAIEAAFWFYPLVWWLGTRLIDERERACDEEVLRLGSEPEIYADSLLKTCRFCLESPLFCTSGVMGSSIRKRIEGIMTHRFGSQLDLGRKLLLVCAAIAAVGGPVAIGIEAQSQYTTPLSFSTVSVGPGQPGWGVGRSIGTGPDGRFSANNLTLRRLVIFAFDLREYQLSGGPDWMDSDTFDIDASAGIAANPEQVRLMLRALLADRFKLTFHRETRELPVYALTAAIDGRDGIWMGRGTLTDQGMTPAQFAHELSSTLDRAVINNTGLSGKYKWTQDDEPVQPGELGLKLEPQKGPVDVVVIDSASKLSEN